MAPSQASAPAKIMPPSIPTRASPLSHPRRPPPHRSVSLLHASRIKPSRLRETSDSSSDGQASDPRRITDRQPNSTHQNNANNKHAANSNTPSSRRLALARDSSGESSNADNWFEKSNNDVSNNRTSFVDNDPPFFLRNSSSSGTPPDGSQQPRPQNLAPDGPLSLPMRTGLLPLGTDGSSTEDFRGVIDDLTVENKKLKRKLKRYEKLHDSHLRDEKLFEVRVHGLPPEKKRELEDTLRKFTASLNPNGFHPDGYEGLLPVLNHHHQQHHRKATSSQASLQNPDSAYASMSASGQGSSAPSGNDHVDRLRLPNAATRRQNIHSYLHHIPEALMLHPNPATMSERAKKKLVLRRLEQIFAGKGAGAGIHQHPIQQQEISHLAARENRLTSDAQGPRARQEGSREARIMAQDVEDLADPATRRDDNRSPDGEMWSRLSSTQTHKPSLPPAAPLGEDESQAAVEQRPTRPLDVDPHRAQVPADNMRYIRHLGFSPPDVESGHAIEEGHGWIYLNLLINMAQLHTINVTSDFVRKALTEHHSWLELSHDGRKVRWKGGQTATAESSSGGASSNHYAGMDTPDGESPRKRPKLSRHASSRQTNASARHRTTSARGQEHNKLVYTPLFFHRSGTESDDSSSEEENEDDLLNSPYPRPAAGDSSGMTSSGVRTISTKKTKKRDDGPMIFYTNARFCTDLSGDRTFAGNNTTPYTKMSSVPIGFPSTRTAESFAEKRGPLADASDLPEPMNLSDNPIPESMELFVPPHSPTDSSGPKPVNPIDMEVCGIGGVWPTDNFAIAVQSQQAQLNARSTRASHLPPIQSSVLPSKFQHLLRAGTSPTNESRRPCLTRRIVSVQRRDLAPSELPPALGFMPFDDANDDDDDSEIDDEMSMSPESPGAFPPSTAPQPVELHYTSSDEDVDDEDDDDDDADLESDSLDLLATAREVDPEAIRLKEREYDANMAERLAEEIPAGSSAATAGGGSGFASPANDADRNEYKRILKEARARSERSTRAKTTDSMVAQHQDSSEEDEDEDEDEEMSDIGS